MYPERKFRYWSESRPSQAGPPRGLPICLAVPAVLLLVLICAGGVLWYLAPGYYPDALERLAVQTPVRIFHDGNGHPLYYQRTYDYQWRFQIPLEQISPEVIRVMLACEDMQFYHHRGVDYRAIFRSAGLNLRAGRIVSGASTITMQLAGLDLKHDRRRTFRAKFIQASQARYLEKHYSKDRILAEYLNRIPFGGKIYGIEAAARFYFGKHASQLNLLEASLICGLPQRPNTYRPDRNLEKALRRQKTVLKMMVHHGLINAGQAAEMAAKGRYCFRDFSRGSPFNEHFLDYDRHYLRCAAREQGDDSGIVRTFFRPEWQRLLKEALEQRKQSMPGVEDYAGVLLENRDRRVLAMVGTRDFQEKNAGQVNAALARRSAGSLLKPLIYAEAMDGGLLVMDSILRDGPIRYGGYAPENYDGRYYGRIRAGEALAMSLNTPVVALLAELSPARVAAKFQEAGLASGGETAAEAAVRNGLSLALGTAGYHLLELTRAMAVLPARGLYADSVFTEAGETERQPPRRIFSPGTAAMIARMLRMMPLPGCEFEAAWKTGTSNGNQDAWCIAFTPEYTLGIWFGNKDGMADQALVGRAAAPAAAAVLSRLYSSRPGPDWSWEQDWLQTAELCPVSGLRPGPACPESRISGLKIRDIPLRQCRSCRPGRNAMPALKILSPRPAVYQTSSDGLAVLSFQASVPSAVWYINGRCRGVLKSGTPLRLSPGFYRIWAVHPDPAGGSASLQFRIKERQGL